ncbi:hypothetical protein AGMMS49936_03920 [Endomicrobiia bacterium]|nr:hypothetical protein AGMMS49936_03920 [Endomicrobiia bacterium]
MSEKLLQMGMVQVAQDVSGASANERAAQKRSWLRQGKKLGRKGKYLRRDGKKLIE